MARKKKKEQKPFADRFPTRGSTILERLGENVRQLREECGLSQEALSDRTDIQQTEISKIENCRSNPTVLTLERLAEALGVTVPELLLPGVVQKSNS